MCGIIAYQCDQLTFNQSLISLKKFLQVSSRRGSDASGICLVLEKEKKTYFEIFRSQKSSNRTLNDSKFIQRINYYKDNSFKIMFVIAHTRLSTDGESTINKNNQPLINKDENSILIFNGIIANDKDLRKKYKTEFETENDGEWLNHFNFDELKKEIKGAYSTIKLNIHSNKLELEYFTNTGSQYFCKEFQNHKNIILSEKGFFKKFGIKDFYKVDLNKSNKFILKDIDANNFQINIHNIEAEKSDQVKVIQIIKPLIDNSLINNLEKKYEEISNKIIRCSKCVLPSTHPFIKFDNNNVCNFCQNSQELKLKGEGELKEKLSSFLGKNYGDEKVLLGLSGGRDSSYALHLLVNKFNIKPITYYYDWGLNTDIARKNVAIMTGSLGIENVMIAADIRKKRENIKKNINAWLNKPHLGIVPLFMAGDKEFISNARKVKKELNTKLEIFAFNLHEKTQFKEEFTGFKMWESNTNDCYGEQLKTSSQLKMLFFYGIQFLLNPKYINSSLFDSFKGFLSYYHSNVDILQFFEYIDWDENKVNETLINNYGWNTAWDCSSTWRIGDGTASFYNLIYYLFSGFTENDVLRSNLIRQKKMTRDEGLRLVFQENKFRYPTLDWYFKLFNLDTELILTKIYNLSREYGRV